MKKRLAAIILTAAVLLSLIPLSPTALAASALPFEDVAAADWFYDAVRYAYGNSLMNGTSDTRFEPQTTLTRAMFVTILGRMDGVTEDSAAKAQFSDVPDGQWYTVFVAWAAENGIVNGTGTRTFSPDDAISREQMATIIARYITAKAFDLPDGTETVSSFLDADDVSDWARDGLSLMQRTGIIVGDDTGCFRPQDTATRAQAATVFMRLRESIAASEQQEKETPVPKPTASTVPTPPASAEPKPSDVPPEVIVTPDEDAYRTALSDLIRRYEGNVDTSGVRDHEYDAGRLIVSSAAQLDLSGFRPDVILQNGDLYIIQFANAADAEKCAAALSGMHGVDFAEPDALNYPCEQAGSDNASEDTKWNVKMIGADEYISRLEEQNVTGSAVVAVLDTGIDAAHTHFSGRLLSGTDIVENDDTPQDLHSHGTHVAGTIIDCTPGLDINILPVRVLGHGEEHNVGYTSEIVEGIRYAADHGANVINLSLGGDHSEHKDNAIADARAKGVTVVAAAGNDNKDNADLCPAHCEDAITVAAVDAQRNRYNRNHDHGSNHGSAVDIAAPGVEVVSAVPNQGTAAKTGTSMAAPHVSAAAALLYYADPTLRPDEIQTMLTNNAVDLGEAGWDPYFGFGLLSLSDIPVHIIGLQIRVIDAETNQNLPDAVIHLYQVGTKYEWLANTDELGEFADTMSPGSYRVEVSLDGYDTASYGPFTISEEKLTSLQIRLQSRHEITVSGTVVDAFTEKRIAGAEYHICDVNGNLFGHSMYSDADGKYSVKGTADELSELLFSAPGYLELRFAPSGQTTSYTVRLLPEESAIAFAGGDGSEADPFLVKTAQQLRAMRFHPTAHFRLIADIDLNGYGIWTPIGTPAVPFSGVIDGNGHTVSNLNLGIITDGNRSYCGFIGVANGTAIHDLKMAGLHLAFEGTEDALLTYCGGLIAYNTGRDVTIRSCSVELDYNHKTTSTSRDTNAWSGGLIGCSESAVSLTDVSVNGAVSMRLGATRATSFAYFGGAVGYCSDLIVRDFDLDGSVLFASSECANHSWIGGLVGKCSTLSVQGCVIDADVSAGDIDESWLEDSRMTFHTGGVAGEARQLMLHSAAVTGNIISHAEYGSNDVGGLAGRCGDADHVVDDCHYVGTISGHAYIIGSRDAAGGLIGTVIGSCTVTDSSAECEITARGYDGGAVYVGGLVGFANGKLTLRSCSADGTLTATAFEGASYSAYVGGAAGYAKEIQAEFVAFDARYPLQGKEE